MTKLALAIKHLHNAENLGGLNQDRTKSMENKSSPALSSFSTS
jgi:hypothetical protein